MHIKQHAQDLSKTVLASVIATMCDGALYSALVMITPKSALHLGVIAGLGAALGGVIHFTLCRLWVYERFERNLWRSVLAYVPMSRFVVFGHGADANGEGPATPRS